MSYNPFKVGSSTFKASGPVERKKAEQKYKGGTGCLSRHSTV